MSVVVDVMTHHQGMSSILFRKYVASGYEEKSPSLHSVVLLVVQDCYQCNYLHFCVFFLTHKEL